MDGELYYTPIANDYSGFGDPRRFYRTYYLNPIQTETESVVPNTIALKFKEEFSSIGMKTNFLISKTGPGVVTQETNTVNLHFAIRPAYLRGRPIAGRNYYVSDVSISTPEEAAAVALNMGQLHSKETRTATMSVLGDPSFSPGEVIQVRNSPLLRMDTTPNALTTHTYNYQKDKCAYLQWEYSKVYCWAEILDKIRISGGVLNQTSDPNDPNAVLSDPLATPESNPPASSNGDITQTPPVETGTDQTQQNQTESAALQAANKYSAQVSNSPTATLYTESPTDIEVPEACTDFIVTGSTGGITSSPSVEMNVNQGVAPSATSAGASTAPPTPANYYCGVSKGQIATQVPEAEKTEAEKEEARTKYQEDLKVYEEALAEEEKQKGAGVTVNSSLVKPVDPDSNNESSGELAATENTTALGSLVTGANNPRESSYRQEPRSIWRIQAVKHKYNAAGTQGYETELILTSPF
jgi:hypothetical protein